MLSKGNRMATRRGFIPPQRRTKMSIYKSVVCRLSLSLGLLAALAAPASATTGSYGYFRVVEGSATPGAGRRGRALRRRVRAEINQPVLAGDRLTVPDRSRCRDRARRPATSCAWTAAASSSSSAWPARPTATTGPRSLRLLEGNLQLVVTQDSLGDELPRIDTPNATIYSQDYGIYRVTADGDGWSQVVVRRGTRPGGHRRRPRDACGPTRRR